MDETIRDIHAAALANGEVLADFDLLPMGVGMHSTPRRAGPRAESPASGSTSIDKRNLRAEMGRAFSVAMDDGDGAEGGEGYCRSPMPLLTSPAAGVSPTYGIANSYTDLFRSDYLWVTLPLWAIYLCYGFTYYGLVLFVTRIYSEGAKSNIDGDEVTAFEYRDIFSSALVECVGVFLASLLMDSFGRRLPMFAFYAIGAVAVTVLPQLSGHGRLALSLVGRVCGIAATGATWVMTPELYPTPLRASGHSSAQCLSRIGAVLCPFVVQRRSFGAVGVGVVLGCLNAVAAGCTLLLRETKGVSMERGSDCSGGTEDAERSSMGIDSSGASTVGLMARGRDSRGDNTATYSKLKEFGGTLGSRDSDDDVEMVITL